MTPKMLRELVDVVVRYNMGYVYRVRPNTGNDPSGKCVDWREAKTLHLSGDSVVLDMCKACGKVDCICEG